MLRSEIKHLASAESTQEVGNTSSFFFLLSCSRHLLHALFLNGARLKLVYFLTIADRQTNGWTDRLAVVRPDERRNYRPDRETTEVLTDSQTNVRTDRLTVGRPDQRRNYRPDRDNGSTDRQTDQRTDRQTDGWTARPTKDLLARQTDNGSTDRQTDQRTDRLDEWLLGSRLITAFVPSPYAR